MGKILEVSDMPPLTLELTSQLRAMERDLRLALGSCCDNYDLIDREAAFEYVRTYAVKFYDCFFSFYSHHPDQTYKPHWRTASERFAFQRVVRCIERNSAVKALFFDAERSQRVQKTISDHAERSAIPGILPTIRPLKQTPELTRAGIDMASASPLLMYVAQYSQADEHQPRRNSRETVVLPILESKGWSILDWSLEANVAYHTAADYVAGKRTPYPSTRKKLAEALGLTVQQLPI